VEKREGSMEYERFIAEVQDAAEVDTTEEAERITRTTLTTLAVRLGGGEAGDLADQLPEPLKEQVADAGVSQERFTLEDFFARIGEAEDIDPLEAEERVRAVTGVMSEAITRGELIDVFSRLPEDFTDLFSPRS
jgi:uncharacterized protein (DUF2267 family)